MTSQVIDAARAPWEGPLMTPPRQDTTARGVTALAAGRLLLGLGGLLAPGPTCRAFGMTPTPELVYMTRIFGARAMALGGAWSLASGAERERLGRIGLAVDVADTLGGGLQAARGELPRGAAVALLGVTSAYAAVGAAHVVAGLRSS